METAKGNACAMSAMDVSFLPNVEMGRASNNELREHRFFKTPQLKQVFANRTLANPIEMLTRCSAMTMPPESEVEPDAFATRECKAVPPQRRFTRPILAAA